MEFNNTIQETVQMVQNPAPKFNHILFKQKIKQILTR